MNSQESSPQRKSTLVTPSFWVIAAMIVLMTIFHYYQEYLLPPSVIAFFSRHALDRILFLIPIIFSTYSYNRRGGILTLAAIVLLLLPRVIWISSNPLDALTETIAVLVVGYYIIHIISSQAEEKLLHQAADAHQIQVLQCLNKVSEQITSELELERILPKVLQIAEELTAADGGGIALIDPQGDLLSYPYLHNLPQELSTLAFSKENGAAGEVLSTGRSVFWPDYQSSPHAIPNFVEAGLVSVISVPIIQGEHIFGALTLAKTHQDHPFSDRDVDILDGIGRQTGIAIENAHLYDRMRFYAQMLSNAQEGERKRIARELHDETVQILITLSRRIESLATNSELPSDQILKELSSLKDLTGTAVQDLRRFIQDLRPSILDHLGLIEAVEDLTSRLEENNIEGEFHLEGDVQRLPQDKELILFRIAQEALNNIRRHSEASRATVEVRFLPETLEISITDNGHGFVLPTRMDDLVSSGRLGLLGMQERARILDGTLVIQSEPGMGTALSVKTPL